MRRYIDHAILWDILVVSIIGICFFYNKQPLLNGFITLPKIESLFSFGISLISVSATLLGFLLTIITVLVTFKKGFDDKSEANNRTKEPRQEVQKNNIFDQSISKEAKFYDSDIHKHVVSVFINATYEIGLCLMALLIIQFNVICISEFLIALVSFCIFLILLLSITRCLYIFKLFLGVHIPISKDNSNRS
jgi:hypothetical protein